MATHKDYLYYITERLSGLGGLGFRAMMGEYIIYLDGKTVGGLYDDRFFVKLTDSARSMLPDARIESPYPGARGMLLVEDTEDGEFLRKLLCAVSAELPAAKRKISGNYGPAGS